MRRCRWCDTGNSGASPVKTEGSLESVVQLDCRIPATSPGCGFIKGIEQDSSVGVVSFSCDDNDDDSMLLFNTEAPLDNKSRIRSKP